MRVKWGGALWRGEVASLLKNYKDICFLLELAEAASDAEYRKELVEDIDRILRQLPDSISSNRRYKLTPESIVVLGE